MINIFSKNKQHQIYFFLIMLAIVINGIQIFSPFNIYLDTMVYFNVSKNILTHHWFELFYENAPWLDKPHFPFWISSISFYLFGVNSFSYILPGFVFHLIGAFFTYKLSLELYKNEKLAITSALLYLTAFNLILSAINIKAEAYLLGEIIPAVYFWLKYNQSNQVKHLLLGAIFTSFALMTKGPFTLLPIFSGIFSVLIFQKKFSEILSLKWIKALLLSLLFIFPEILADYLQFGLEGIRWFFIESQFGRFFNTGRIVNHNGNFFYFFHVFIWAFLPWSIIFYYGTFLKCKNFSKLISLEKENLIFLLSSFVYTFLLFSITKFQLDHYINIIFPFAAILSAKYFNELESTNAKLLIKIQSIIAIVILVFSILIVVKNMIINPQHIYFLGAIFLPLILMILIFWGDFKKSHLNILIYPILSIFTLIMNLWLIIDVEYPKYDAGYAIHNILNKSPNLDIYAFHESFNLPMYENITTIHQFNALPKDKSFYLVLNQAELPKFQKKYPNNELIANRIPFAYTRFYLQALLKSEARLNSHTEYKTLLRINPILKST